MFVFLFACFMQAVSAHIAFIADSGKGCHINLSCISSHTGICKAMKERKLPSLLIVIATKWNYWLTAKNR